MPSSKYPGRLSRRRVEFETGKKKKKKKRSPAAGCVPRTAVLVCVAPKQYRVWYTRLTPDTRGILNPVFVVNKYGALYSEIVLFIFKYRYYGGCTYVFRRCGPHRSGAAAVTAQYSGRRTTPALSPARPERMITS